MVLLRFFVPGQSRVTFGGMTRVEGFPLIPKKMIQFESFSSRTKERKT